MDNNTSNNITDEFRSEAEDSDDGLKIVIDSPQTKRKNKAKQLELSPDDKEIIETVANDLEKTLEEKAAKANLTASNVKNIIKHVVTNEHVLALVRQVEDPESKINDLLVYEPKLTRAKAKELFPSQVVASIPWITQAKPSSEVQVLISEELQEDSSGDEYIPGDEESEDDKDSSVHSESEPFSLDPPTPKNADSFTQTNWSEDGIFKIPHVKTKESAEEDANIAKRTRSKLSLSSTPLEVIEEAFIPPDITTDMYDMDCDDDDWKDFLKTFTRPLDEVTKDDEDHDPEYNVLADEEIDKVDKEELRADKAVKVTRKELNELMAELFEYADNFTQENQDSNQVLANCGPQVEFTILDNGTVEQTNITSLNIGLEHSIDEEVKMDEIKITEPQKSLLQQQMRQHVQMLAQNFILGYQHPEYYEVANKCKEYLNNLKCLSSNKTFSYFSAINLQPALSLIEFWERKFEDNDQEVQNAKAYVAKIYYESKTAMTIGNTYIPTFPQLILQTISKSNVFLYASLLPRIPFKPVVNTAAAKLITRSENELIALGLEQFIQFLANDPHHIAKNGKVRMKHVCYYIQRYMMPIRDYYKIHRQVLKYRSLKVDPNPIQYYFQNNRAPITVHYVIELDQLGIIPPCQRKPEDLPFQWKQYLFPNIVQPQVCTNILIPIIPSNATKNVKPPTYKDFITKKRRILPKPSNNPKSISRKPVLAKKKTRFENESIRSFNDFKINSKASSTPIAKPRKLEQYFKSPQVSTEAKSFISHLKFNSAIFKNLVPKNNLLDDKMLPSMPSLNTPSKRSPERCVTPPPAEVTDSKVSEINDVQPPDPFNHVEEVCDENKTDLNEESIEKDNVDDINALMVASSTVKPVRKKTLSGAEKKKAKLKKELNAALSILSPEDEVQSEEKTNRYVQAFYDKLQERLDIHEYHRLVDILSNFEESHDSVVHLYKNVNDILSPKYADLTDEFLSFLTSSQAKAVGKLVPHIMINNMSLFLRKLEMYFKGQPFQARRIYRSLTELADCVDVTMDRVKSTILPLLKGNKLLIDWFLQIFPCEQPPQSLLNGTWENVEVGKDSTFNTKEDVYETIVVPEVEDPYGGPNCICTCHDVEDQAFKSRSRHCVPCGTKFLQGRIYVHTGKGLRLAKVTFENSNVDHYKRLGYQSSVHHHKRRSEISPSKHLVSPIKDAQDDIRMSNESEDDVDYAKKKQQRLSKTPRKRRPKVKREKKILDGHKIIPTATKLKIAKSENVSGKERKVDALDQVQENVSNCSVNEPKPVTEEAMEWDCNTSIESVELKLSPEPSAESESGETSQDNINTDSDCSTENVASPAHLHSENSNSNTGEEISWSKEEDKIILETFRREGDREETFQQISDVLENRSVAKVKSRFQTLLNFIQEMAARKVL